MYLIFSIILLITALVLFRSSSKQRKQAGLPGGKVIYTDTSQWDDVVTPLYDPVTRLTGKPDYLIRTEKGIIPVEVKSGRTPDAPYDSHIYQLAAYCLLVDREFGQRPPYGIIHYGQRTFQVEYTQRLENSLIDLLTEMRKMERKKNVPRSHQQAARCRGCGFNHVCDQVL